jgi:hypothetical protein
MAHNEGLKDLVRHIYADCVEEFKKDSVDFSSTEFFSQFPFMFIRTGDADLRGRISSAAFSPPHRSVAEQAIQGFYANWSGGNLDHYMCEAINDFLNYVIPRAAGLQDEMKVFDEVYSYFDESLYGDSFLVTTVAILGNVWDNSGRVVLPDGFSLGYVGLPVPSRANSKWLRRRAIPYFEIRKSAHPIGRGRELKGEHSFFVFEHSKLLSKSNDMLGSAARLRDEITRKFIFAVRLLKLSAAFSDYRGVRMLGKLASHHIHVMNFPDEFISQGPSFELGEHDGLRLRRLPPRLAGINYNDLSVLDTKLDDLIRRPRETMLEEKRTQLKVAIEQLLDCFQIIEALIPVAGSEYIALYAAVLLKAGGHTQFLPFANDPISIYDFIKRMHKVRNDVMHGRIDEVLNPKKPKLDQAEVHAFRRMVFDLAALSILNGNKLREFATKLALGEITSFESFYPISVEEMNEMKKQKPFHPSW